MMQAGQKASQASATLPKSTGRERSTGPAPQEQWFVRYRPRFNDWRFWAIQGLVLFVAGTHITAETLGLLGHIPYLGTEPRVSLASFVTVSLFFVPVVYAALNFGFAGSVATALWCTILTLPNVIFFHHGMEIVREIFQIVVVDAIAIFVGQRVDREMSLRRSAEEATAALKASESKYRGLFESSPTAILVLDPEGTILEANPAAGRLYGRTPPELKGTTLADLLGPEQAQHLLALPQNNRGLAAPTAFALRSSPEVYLEPALTWTLDSQGSPIVLLLLQDITEERQRQAGLRAYAAYILRAQEEERQRIAQELHDETVQALVLICRQMDIAEGEARALSDPALGGLRDARRSAEQVIKALRDFARVLRPPTLEDLGLVTSVRRLVVDLSERAQADGRLRIVGKERRLPADIELALFRIAQEALRNVERHARATTVQVNMNFAEQEASLEVIDNGIGFTPPGGPGDLASGGRLGLLGMQERAELLGGRLEIHSLQGKGTKVRVSIPLQLEKGH